MIDPTTIPAGSDPTNATRDAHALVVAHGSVRAVWAMAEVLKSMGLTDAARDLRDIVSDLSAEGRSVRRARWIAG